MPSQEQKILDSKEKQSTLLIPGAIIIAGVLIAGAIMYSNGKGNIAEGSKNNLAGGAAAPAVQGDLASDGPMLGDPKAPVTVVEFADFQCPFCGRFFKTTGAQLIEKYVKTGKVKFVYRDFAFLGEESEWAGEAAECAKEQGKFWEYHDYLFNHQNGENQGAFSKDHLKEFASAVGLDQAKFDTCLDTDKYVGNVRKDTEAGKTAGVSGTPTTFVDGKIVVGAVPISQFDTMITEALKKAK